MVGRAQFQCLHPVVVDLEAVRAELVGRGAGGAADPREPEVLGLLDTVKKHVSHLLDKLGAENRTQAVARARELGVIG